VLDSLSELRLLSDSPLRYRRHMLSMKQSFAGEAITVIFLDDHSSGTEDMHVQSIAHGVFAIEQNVSAYGVDRRRLRITKLRGVGFLGGYHDAVVVKGGLKVFPRVTPADARQSDVRSQVQSGVPELDALFGGGLERGTSCLLLGPAGCGKSSIALQFAVEAAKRGEKSLLCLFEENIGTLRARARSIGMPIDDLVKAGALQLIEIDPADLSPGQLAAIVVENVRERGAKLVLIDSLNGYMQALPDVQTLTVQMHELLSFLNHEGVLSLVTVAQSGLVGQMNTPVELTYLADSVILLRFFEQAGRVKKAISVIKKRTGRHEDSIRELRLDAQGIQVGDPLEQFRGVLTGTPIFTGERSQMLKGRE
jgi:circadian clock protein KaiC